MAEDFNVTSNLLVRGTSCWMRISKDTSGANPVKVGMVDSFRGSKNIQTQRSQVCGAIVPASIDPQGISTNISVSGFMPTKKVLEGKQTYNGWDKDCISLASFNPNDDSFIENQQITKIPYIDFYDANTKTIIAKFFTVLPTQFNITVNGGSYVKADLNMEAIKMSSGSDYTSQTFADMIESL